MEENNKSGKGGLFMQYRPVVIALIAGICAIICVSIFTGNIIQYKKNAGGTGITATGSASVDFESDLVVWRGSFSVEGSTPKDAYSRIKKDGELVKSYLKENGVSDDEMVFSSVRISPTYTSTYDDEGRYIGDVQTGYELVQSMTVTSGDIDKVELISRDITNLIESGVELESDLPEYYYTKLDELKLDLISKATANAKERIDLVAGGCGAQTDKLLTANLGVFQITATNSGTESYSYGGSFNTTSRFKTANITVRLNYSVK
ncbi:MAG: SIMPL domain-containing protein [Enterocloster asparagiformis]|nr:SIMPL domain-containing protein [Enterocloster asparagiformis]